MKLGPLLSLLSLIAPSIILHSNFESSHFPFSHNDDGKLNFLFLFLIPYPYPMFVYFCHPFWNHFLDSTLFFQHIGSNTHDFSPHFPLDRSLKQRAGVSVYVHFQRDRKQHFPKLIFVALDMDTIITITFIQKPSIWKLLSSADQVSDERNNRDTIHYTSSLMKSSPLCLMSLFLSCREEL